MRTEAYNLTPTS